MFSVGHLNSESHFLPFPRNSQNDYEHFFHSESDTNLFYYQLCQFIDQLDEIISALSVCVL